MQIPADTFASSLMLNEFLNLALHYSSYLQNGNIMRENENIKAQSQNIVLPSLLGHYKY